MNKCIVKLKDIDGTEHSATVWAETLYEATLRGLNELNRMGWESDKNETIPQVVVEVHSEPTTHIVDVPRLLKWVRAPGALISPAATTRKEKLRALLGERGKLK